MTPTGSHAPVRIVLAAALALAGSGCTSRPPPPPLTPGEAAATARERLGVVRRESGEKSIEAARCLDALVEALYRAGQATGDETRRSAEESLEIRRKVLPPDDPELAASLNNLGAILHARGDYGRARDHYQSALAIRKKALAVDSPTGAPPSPSGKEGLVEILNNLAEAERRMGDIAAAKVHFREAIDILESEPVNGRRAQSLAMLRSNLGLLLQDAGDLGEAKKSMENARDFWEGKPERRRDLARVSNNLGRLLHDLGDLAAARQSFERALEIQQGLDLPNRPEEADIRNNFGYLYSAAGDPAKAKPLYLAALSLREEALGKEHPSLAWTLINLGLLELQTGDSGEALPLLERAAAIRKESFGEDHWLYGHSLTYLACLRLLAGETGPALEQALRAEEIRRDALLLAIPVLAERQALGMASLEVFGLSASSLDLALSAALSGAPETTRVWNALMGSRGLVLEEAARRLRAGGTLAAAGKLREDLAVARQELANLWVRGALRQSGESYRNLLGEARRRVEEAEAALGLSSPSPRSKGEGARNIFEETRAALSALPAGSALLAFSRYQKVEPPRAGRLRTVPSYLAFFIGGTGEPRAFDLGPAREIDDLVSRWRTEVLGAATPGGGARSETPGTAGEELRRKVWDPMGGALRDARRLFVVPDGSLNLVSFAGLPAAGGGSILESGPLIHYLSAEKDLRLFPMVSRRNRWSGSLLAVGDPDFGVTGSATSIGAPGPAAGFRDLLPHFERLPATGQEIEEVAATFLGAGEEAGPEGPGSTVAVQRNRITRLTGPLATESAFKRLAPGKNILHLATHGFFLESGPARARPGPAGLRGVGEPEAEGASADPPEGFENPLLLSGLALAGVNRREDAGADDDGILSGEEIAALDLSGVEWAVLSACKTGVGKIRRGEGVLGLRRAFQVAGAGTLIASLWPVADQAAREWMAALYRARFIERLDSAEAAREASLAVLRARRERNESDSPFYWAGFVASGDWR